MNIEASRRRKTLKFKIEFYSYCTCQQYVQMEQICCCFPLDHENSFSYCQVLCSVLILVCVGAKFCPQSGQRRSPCLKTLHLIISDEIFLFLYLYIEGINKNLYICQRPILYDLNQLKQCFYCAIFILLCNIYS